MFFMTKISPKPLKKFFPWKDNVLKTFWKRCYLQIAFLPHGNNALLTATVDLHTSGQLNTCVSDLLKKCPKTREISVVKVILRMQGCMNSKDFCTDCKF